MLATFLLATPAFAHDPKKHKGPRAEGEVVSVTEPRLEMGTKDGPVLLTLFPQTTVNRREGGEKASKADLKPGQDITVAGHQLAGGGLVYLRT